MRIALLSNVTIDFLVSKLKKKYEVYLPAGFDTWQQEIMLTSSGLYEFKPEAVVILLHADVYEWETHEIIDGWNDALMTLSGNLPGVPVFVSSLDIHIPCHFGSEQRKESIFEDYLVRKVEVLHESGLSIYILPVKDLIADIGRNNFYSDKMWYMGSMPYSMRGIDCLSELINRYVSVVKGKHRKCIAVDLDNTLWGGVIGEDGVDGIELSKHKEGARYYDTQKFLKKMKDQGVMLAIVSKNNVEDVEPVFKHPDMILRHEDFVAEIVNWEPKTKNIKELAKNLNIGLDSFVFLDDNPAEREAMKAECPEVAVIDFPADSSMLPRVVEEAYNKFFLSLEVTGEDAKKTEMYRAETQRRMEMHSATSAEDFLKKLEMTMYIHRMMPEEEKRVVQLINKTNQFNVTTKRYSEEEIKELVVCGDVVTVHMADKYGDQGLVAVLILVYRDSMAEIDTFLMSCRVMGRNAENEIVGQIKGMLERKGVTTVTATYLKTKKNAPVADLFDKLGFDTINVSEDRKDYRAEVSALPITTGVFKEVVSEL